jgi:hypothetical protein
MHIDDIYRNVMRSTEGNKPRDGLWWNQCAGTDKEPPYRAFSVAVDKRLVAKLPGIEMGNKIELADEKLLDICRQWKPELVINDVTSAVDAALKKVMDKVAEEHTKGKGKNEKSR